MESIHLEASRNSLLVFYLGSPILDGKYDAMKSYWRTLCSSARGPLVTTDDSTTSRWRAAAKESAERWITNGLRLKEQWTQGGFGQGWW